MVTDLHFRAATARNALVIIAVVVAGAAFLWLRGILTPLALALFLMVMIDGFARVLELDPSEISVQSRSLFANTEPATEANEDVKVSSEKTGPDDFLDSIPFAVD